MTTPPATLAEGVRAVLAAATGTELAGAEVRRLTGGASREIYAVRATDHHGRETTAVLRRDPPGRGEADRMRAEVACLRAASAAGVPVPEVLAAGDTAPGIEAPYLLMNTVPGESIPRKVQRDPGFAAVRAHLAEDFGHILGLVHRAPVNTLTMLDDRDPLDAIEQTYRDLAEPRPAVEIGLRWLRDNRPPERAACLVHGDFRLGNLLIDADGIRGVLDWELAHLGNPIEDLGWLCVRAWRFGAAAPVGGLGTRDQLLDGYQRATGEHPSAAELHWWEVFGTLKWLVLSRFQAERHLGGAEHSLELAAIGRRVCESEYDLLDVLGLLDSVPGDSAPQAPAPTVHDRPDLGEIMELVTEALTGEIGPALPEDATAQRYLLRICASLLQIGGRELRAGAGPTDRVHEMLRTLDCPSEAVLAERLRSGALTVADPRVRATVNAAVETRLRVSNPRRLG